MANNSSNWALYLTFAGIVFSSCSFNKSEKMSDKENVKIIEEVKSTYKKITEYSEKAQLDSFLSYYDDFPDFLSISADGKMSNYQEFKNACNDYYSSLKQQRIVTVWERFNVINKDLVLVAWTGNIQANFRNGDTVKMNNYSITSVFRNVNGSWKVIHDHESALPPEIIKKP